MSDQPGSTSGTPEPVASAQPQPGTPASAPAVPAGYVPQTELDKERERARGFQAEADRAKAALAAAQAPAAPAPSTADQQPTDILGLVRGAVSEAVSTVLKVGELRDAAGSLKTEFPHADPSFFTKERLAQFDSADSLRAAVEADHTRVAEILKAHGVKVDEARRDEAAAAAAGGAGPTSATTPAAGGDPTLEQLNEMSLGDIDALEKEKPGTVARVMGAAR